MRQARVALGAAGEPVGGAFEAQAVEGSVGEAEPEPVPAKGLAWPEGETVVVAIAQATIGMHMARTMTGRRAPNIIAG
jgi:hypothetical protein